MMNQEKEWMLMTYFCPTHGDPGRIEPIEITKKEIINTYFENATNKKKINFIN